MGILRVLTKGKKEQPEALAQPAPVMVQPPTPVIVQPPAIPQIPEEELFEEKYKVFDITDFVAAPETPFPDAKFRAAYCNILIGIYGELRELNKSIKALK